jgi:hypothetical protein
MLYQTLPAWAKSQPNPENLTKRDAEALLQHYSFDLGNRPLQVVLAEWQAMFSLDWIKLAVIEALYLGRYKAVSVEQILRSWVRRKQPMPHFSYEFEHLVCDRFPRTLLQAPAKNEFVNEGTIAPLASVNWFPDHVPGWMTLAKRIQAERIQAMKQDSLIAEFAKLEELDALETLENL